MKAVTIIPAMFRGVHVAKDLPPKCRPSVGIRLEDCDDVTINDSEFRNIDVPVEVIRTNNLKARGNRAYRDEGQVGQEEGESGSKKGRRSFFFRDRGR